MKQDFMIELIMEVERNDGIETLLDKDEMQAIFADYSDELDAKDVTRYIDKIPGSNLKSGSDIIQEMFNIKIDLKYILNIIESESGFDVLLDTDEMESVFEDYNDKVDRDTASRYLERIPGSKCRTIDDILNAMKFQIRFVSDGKVISEIYLNKGDEIIAPVTTPKRAPSNGVEYRFEKWNGFKTGDKAVRDAEFDAEFSESIIEHSITFKAEGKTVCTMTLPHNETISAPAAPSKKSDSNFDYKFKEWTGFAKGMKATEDKTFVATFTPIPVDEGSLRTLTYTRPMGGSLFHDCGYQMYWDTKANIMKCNVCAYIANGLQYRGPLPPRIR